MVIKAEIIDELLSDYTDPEDLLGDGGLFKERQPNGWMNLKKNGSINTRLSLNPGGAIGSR
jgi:hypothetical protein